MIKNPANSRPAVFPYIEFPFVSVFSKGTELVLLVAITIAVMMVDRKVNNILQIGFEKYAIIFIIIFLV